MRPKSDTATEAADVEDSNSVHGFGYCIRDRRHVPAAEPLVLANSESLYDNKLQSSGPKAAARSCLFSRAFFLLGRACLLFWRLELHWGLASMVTRHWSQALWGLWLLLLHHLMMSCLGLVHPWLARDGIPSLALSHLTWLRRHCLTAWPLCP